MALRVLLADESVTIKKVFQVALQDFGAEVTAVTLGTDVAAVAERVHPDIVFADVLLQKRNGYDVCRDIKGSANLANIPVVLIWSGFMELDQQKFQSSGADDHLEKPFDAQKLRNVVMNLVPKTKTQPLAPYLTFPKLPDFDEQRPPETQPAPSQPTTARAENFATPPRTVPQPRHVPPAPPVPDSSSGAWTMDSFEPIPQAPIAEPGGAHGDLQLDLDTPEEFTSVTLATRTTQMPKKQPRRQDLTEQVAADSDEDPQWVQKTLTQFKLKPEKQTEDTPAVTFEVPEDTIDPDKLAPLADDESDRLELNLESLPEEPPPPPARPAKASPPAVRQLSEQELIEIVRAQSKEMIEKVIWQVLPEIATQVIERELARLLSDRKSL